METKQQIGKILIRHGLGWAFAIVTPPIVMVVLDLMDKHTPTSVAIASSMFLLMQFVFSNVLLSKGLVELTAKGESS